VRIACHGRYAERPTAAQAIEQLRLQLAEPSHEFWPDDIPIAEAALFDRSHILGPKQITDVCLLALAVKNGGRFVAFDRSVPLRAVRAAEPKHLVMI
jgi:predicted nucleic acid-binding protein